MDVGEVGTDEGGEREREACYYANMSAARVLSVETRCDPWRSTLPDTGMIDCWAAEDMQMSLTFPRCEVQIQLGPNWKISFRRLRGECCWWWGGNITIELN